VSLHLATSRRREDGLPEGVGKGAGHELRDDNIGCLLGAGTQELGCVGVMDLAEDSDLKQPMTQKSHS